MKESIKNIIYWIFSFFIVNVLSLTEIMTPKALWQPNQTKTPNNINKKKKNLRNILAFCCHYWALSELGPHFEEKTCLVKFVYFQYELKLNSAGSLKKKNIESSESYTFVIVPLSFFPRNKSTVCFCYDIRFSPGILYSLHRLQN
jgi:hypothetical protein